MNTTIAPTACVDHVGLPASHIWRKACPLCRPTRLAAQLARIERRDDRDDAKQLKENLKVLRKRDNARLKKSRQRARKAA